MPAHTVFDGDSLAVVRSLCKGFPGYLVFVAISELAAFFFMFLFATIEVRIGVHIAVVMVDAAT